MLCNEGDVIQTFLLLVCGETTFHLSPITSTQLNNALQKATKIHSKQNPPKIRFITTDRVAPDKPHIYIPLDVIL